MNARPRHPVRAGLWTLVVCVGALTTGPAAAEDLSAAHTALEAQTAAQLEKLAAWCVKKRLFGKRDETYELLLEYDPEHATAREKLRYKKGEDGAWVRDPRYKRPSNWKRGAIKEYDERLAALQAEHRKGLLANCAKADTIANLLWARRQLATYTSKWPGDDRAKPILRRLSLRYYVSTRDAGLVPEMAEAAEELRSLYPEDLEVRATLDEVQHKDAWVPVEVARTLSKAARLEDVVQKALKDAAGAKEVELLPREKKIELPWSPAFATSGLRAVGTIEPEHLKRMAVCCEAAAHVFEAALDTRPVRRQHLAYYVFKEKGEIDTFIAGYPVVENRFLKLRKKLGLALVPLDSGAHALIPNPRAAQLELAVNMTLNLALQDTFLASHDPKGWHAEGITRYLAFKVLGTRWVISVTGDYAGQGGDRKVPESYENWLARAQALFAKKPDVGLALLLGKGVDVFSATDAIIAYAFSVYLIEGHDRLAPLFLRTLWENADVDKTCREVLGLPLAVVEYRFKRWLGPVTAAMAAEAAKAKAAKAKEAPKK